MAGKNPSYQYYPKDWRADPVWACSLAARGLWHEMMDRMHECEPYGYLAENGRPIPDERIARLVGCSLQEYAVLLAELDVAGVPRRNASGIIYSKRMVEDHKKRQEWSQRQQKHRNTVQACNQPYGTPMTSVTQSSMRDEPPKAAQNLSPTRDVTPGVTHCVTPMSRSSSSSSSSSIKKETEREEHSRSWFDRFWKIYPNQIDRDDAWREFLAIDPLRQELCVESVPRWMQSPQWAERQFIPSPVTFLRKRRWEYAPKGRAKEVSLDERAKEIERKYGVS